MAHDHEHSKYKPGELAWGAEHHIVPISKYARNLFFLMLLMGVTIGASYLPYPDTMWGSIGANVIAMSIAVVKATLVIMCFMHIKISTPLTKFWAAIGFVWLILIFFILADYHTRPLDTTIAEPWMNDPGSSLPKHLGDPTSDSVDPLNINVRPRN